MRRNYCISVILMVLMFVLCTGCGENTNTDGDKREATDGAVSGTAVTGSAVGETAAAGSTADEMAPERYFYANSTNLYRDIGFDYDYLVGQGFIQSTRNGEQQEEFPSKDYQVLLSVTEEGVYYVRINTPVNVQDDVQELCRIPIEKKPDGTDRLNLSGTEVILKEESNIQIENVPAYVDDDYIVYVTYEPYIVKYNRKTKEKTEIETDGGNDNTIVSIGSGYLIIASEYGGYYRLDLDSDKAVRVSGEDMGNTVAPMTSQGDYFFRSTRHEDIRVYDGTQDKEALLLSKKELKEACDQIPPGKSPYEMKKGKGVSVFVLGMFCYKERLYINCQILWRQNRKVWMRYGTFSLPVPRQMNISGDVVQRGDDELRYEGEIADCILENSITQTYKIKKSDKAEEEGFGDCDKVAWNPGRILTIQSDKAFLLLNSKGKYVYGRYDLQTKAFSFVDREESPEYYSLYYNTREPFGQEEWRLDSSDMGLMPEFLRGK